MREGKSVLDGLGNVLDGLVDGSGYRGHIAEVLYRFRVTADPFISLSTRGSFENRGTSFAHHCPDDPS